MEGRNIEIERHGNLMIDGELNSRARSRTCPTLHEPSYRGPCIWFSSCDAFKAWSFSSFCRESDSRASQFSQARIALTLDCCNKFSRR